MSVMLFNLGGYRWIMNWMEQKADTRLEARLDNNEYDESSLIEIKVPLDLPYQTDWKNFERCDGAIEINNVHYKYVKRKIAGGFMILKCIPNETRQQLVNARDYFFQLVNDLQQTKPAKKSTAPNAAVIKTVLGDYDEQLQLNFKLPAILSARDFSLYTSPLIPDSQLNTPEQPPEA
jgi:hypothetical protein